jgi:hypothetical protein
LPPTLTVSGRGEVYAEPDYAKIRLGAVAEGKEAALAQKEVSQRIQGALKTLRDLVLPEGNLRTASLSLVPLYDRTDPRESRSPGIIGYRAANNIEIETGDLKQVGAIIDRGIDAGVNQLEHLSFELKDDLPARSQALQKAVQEARSKAEIMAGALGVRLAGIYQATEHGAQVMQPRYEMARMAMAGDSTPVEPGRIRVEASVTLQFQIAGARQP